MTTLEQVGPLKPEVGMGATRSGWTDRYPSYITYVSPSGKLLRARDANHTPGEGFDYFSNQNWVITPDPEGTERTFTLRRNGRWVQKGESMKTGTKLHIGVASYYHDPHF